MKKALFSLLLIVFSIKCYSQCNQTVLPSTTCETAPYVCFNQFCYSTSLESLFCCNGFCGPNTAIHNPQYFAFIPSSPSVHFDISVDECSGGNGLQSAIIDACPWETANILACDPGAPAGGAMELDAVNLVVGQTYWLLIDGSAGATCHYTISEITGVEEPSVEQSLDPLLSGTNTALICPGYQGLEIFTGPDLDASYEWTFGWNNDTVLSIEPLLLINIPEDIAEGGWNVCVRATNGCDTTEILCFPIQIGSTPSVTKEPATFCQEIFPFEWNGIIIDGPGTYTTSTPDEHDCVNDSVWTVMIYPDYSPGVLDTLVCNSFLQLGDNLITASGDYEFFLPGASSTGCDSILQLHVEIGAPEYFIEVSCENDQMILNTQIISQDAAIDTVTFAWFACESDSILSTAQNFIPDSTLCYCLEVSSGLCRDTICSTYPLSPCEFPCFFDAGQGCAGTETLLALNFTLSEDLHADWWIKIPGELPVHVADEDSIYVNFPEPGHYTASVTFRDNENSYRCIGQIDIFERPVLSICCDESICDSCALVTITNTGGSPAEVYLLNGAVIGMGASTQIEVCTYMGQPGIGGIGGSILTGVGCPGTIEGDTFVTITPLHNPIVFIDTFADTLCTFPSDADFFQWRHCGSPDVLSTATCFAPATSGCYCVEVTNEFGCTYETCTDFILSGTKSLNENEIQIKPNPTHGDVDVQLSGSDYLPVPWELTSLDGKVLVSGMCYEIQSHLDFHEVASGIYLMKFNFGKKGILIKKLVVN